VTAIIAVTVPDLMGYEDRLVMEGLAWRLEREPVAADVDEAKLRNNLDNVYLWRGLLDENGRLDKTVYRDENAMKLAQNYAAARISLSRVYERRGRELFRQGKVDEGEAQYLLAIEQLEAAEELRDEFSLTAVPLGILYQAVGRCEDAVRHFGKLIVELEAGGGGADVRFLPEIYYQRGEARLCAKDYGGAIEDYQEVISLVPELWEGYEGAARATVAIGERARAVEIVDTWLTSYAGRAEGSLVRDARAFREALIGSDRDSASPPAGGVTGSESDAP
jgi:tetratricopeptide (TPR) repeat protein